MLIIDGTFPMASSAILQDRDLTLALNEVRSAPKTVRRIEEAPPDSETLATLPEMRRGRVAVAVAKLVQRRYWPGYSTYGYRSDEIVYAMQQGQLAFYRILEAKGEASILRTAKTSERTWPHGRQAPTRALCRSGWSWPWRERTASSGPNRFMSGGGMECVSLRCSTRAGPTTPTGIPTPTGTEARAAFSHLGGSF
jgi:hypothetical protein